MKWSEYASYAHEPPHLLRRVEEEALAALPGGTGPGALTGAFDRTNRGLQGRRLQGPRHRWVTAAISCPDLPTGGPSNEG
jgi:hypothetical protein